MKRCVEVTEELIKIVKEFNQISSRGEKLGLNYEEIALYDALGTTEAAARELGDETL